LSRVSTWRSHSRARETVGSKYAAHVAVRGGRRGPPPIPRRNPERTNDIGCGAGCFDQANRDTVGRVDGLAAAGCDRLPAAFSAPSWTLPAGSISTATPMRQSAGSACLFGNGKQRPGELRTARGNTRIPASPRRPTPARIRRCGSNAATGSWSRPGRCGAEGRSRCPTASPCTSASVRCAAFPSESTAKPGIPRLSTATVRSSKPPSPDGALLDNDLEDRRGLQQRRPPRRPERSRNDEHRQGAHPAQVGAGTHSSISGATGGHHTRPHRRRTAGA